MTRWYKSPLTKEELKSVSARSDIKGLVQTLGYLMLLVFSAAAALWGFHNLKLVPALLILLVHGFFYSFMLNGFHELSHNTVFKSKGLSRFFYRLFSFLSWNNHVFFSASHREHHFYTLNSEKDQEVILPIILTFKEFLLRGIVNPLGFVETLWGTLFLAAGRVDGKMYSGLGAFSAEWKKHLFPEEKQEERKALIAWARVTVAGHLLILLFCLYFNIPEMIVLVTLAPFYGSGFLYFLNPTQHIGLTGDNDDHRKNSRTILLNPFLRFLYWNMNYHIEHHMYAAVPCYNLKKLHKLIEDDLPPSSKGFIRTWRDIRQLHNKHKSNT
ncbi:MAG: fatty acid desaturase [Spirochaetales bacterium]|nr:fatty acid desaturase [Spirochaetales bacterium]